MQRGAERLRFARAGHDGGDGRLHDAEVGGGWGGGGGGSWGKGRGGGRSGGWGWEVDFDGRVAEGGALCVQEFLKDGEEEGEIFCFGGELVGWRRGGWFN